MDSNNPCLILQYAASTEEGKAILHVAAETEKAEFLREKENYPGIKKMDVYLSDIDGVHAYTVIFCGELPQGDYIPWPPGTSNYLVSSKSSYYMPTLSISY